MDIKNLREKIDQIDEKLLPLFIERMGIAKEVAEYKKANGLPVMNKTREREILQKVMEQSRDLEQFAHRFYSQIFEISRSYQQAFLHPTTDLTDEINHALLNTPEAFPQTGIIACQGVEGAYSQMAADRMFPRGNLMFFKSFEAVFDAVESGLCKYGVVPIENSSNGSVRSTYELLRKKNVKIVKSERLCIRHELLAKPGTSLEDITEIYSHEQALSQCSVFLDKLGNKVKIVPCDNTAMAAKMVAESDKPIAAIASHTAEALYGLATICTQIQNSDNNYTRFVCISKNLEIYPGADHISLILACEHKPGALYEVLAKLAALGINLIKLESCPILGHDFEFMFFFELQASVKDEKIVAMLESLKQECEELVFLGNYLEA
ncbi:MAG: chorismate mutase [Clostridia bacterium]|nr:chorismate mutase [Clostridia bacterium]